MPEDERSLPKSVLEFAAHLAQWAAGYNNSLKWNEEAKFKADLMNSRAIWRGVDAGEFEDALVDAGLSDKDAAKLTGHLRRVQSGRRVIPQQSYRDYTWPHDTP
ncbi:hypothetical protein ACPCG0_11710 [Propionibacteriaceae bacterium Y1923]|uniref:hypothetical protein n=1 Tax=Aestuariimicrobium sp. Y1814 TaxID=3418742 RepID=UPI003C155CEE